MAICDGDPDGVIRNRINDAPTWRWRGAFAADAARGASVLGAWDWLSRRYYFHLGILMIDKKLRGKRYRSATVALL